MVKHTMMGLVATAVLVAGCSGNQAPAPDGRAETAPGLSDATSTPSAVGEEGTLVTDAADVNQTLGVYTAGDAVDAYVVDSNRRAVYLLEGDAEGSGCQDACLRDWAPVMPPTGTPTTDGELAPVLVDIVRRPDGTEQMTYNDHPLYHYVGDERVGDTNGHMLEDAWGTWYLVTPQGTAVGEKVGPMPDEPGAPPETDADPTG